MSNLIQQDRQGKQDKIQSRSLGQKQRVVFGWSMSIPLGTYVRWKRMKYRFNWSEESLTTYLWKLQEECEDGRKGYFLGLVFRGTLAPGADAIKIHSF